MKQSNVKLYRLGRAAEELVEYLEKCEAGETKLARVQVMTLVHAINYDYVLWADEVDRANLSVVD